VQYGEGGGAECAGKESPVCLRSGHRPRDRQRKREREKENERETERDRDRQRRETEWAGNQMGGCTEWAGKESPECLRSGFRHRFSRLPTSLARSAFRTWKGLRFGVFRFPAVRVQNLLIKGVMRVCTIIFIS